jgi:hypothetical protein
LSLAEQVTKSLGGTPDQNRADPLLADAHKAEPDQNAEPQAKANYAYARWHIQDDSFTGYAKEWTLSFLFLLKKHWWKWDTKQSRYAPERNVPRWRQRPVTNLVYAVFRSGLAKLTKQRPTFDVVPASGDTDDRNAAKLGESVLHQLWQQLKLSTTHKRTAGWLLTTGNAFLRVHWDTDAGAVAPLTTPAPHPDPEKAAQGETQDVAVDDEGEPRQTADGAIDYAAEPDQMAQGEVAVSLVSPLQIRFNPDAESPEEAEEWYIGSLWPVERAAKQFKLPAAKLITGGDDALANALDLVSAAASSSAKVDVGMATGDKSEEIGARVLVLEYYRKPCADYPEGRHWVQVNRTPVTDEQALPYGFWPPCVAIQDTPVPGQPWAIGLIPQIVPLNDDLNRHTGKIREHQVTMAMGGAWILDPADRALVITSEPNQKLVTKAPTGREPKQAVPVSLPAEVYAERDTIKQDCLLVSGLNENAVGSAPDGSPSGRSLLVQQEISNSVFEPTLLALEQGFSEVGRRMLTLARKYYREDRILRTRGQSGQWEFRAFSGSDLTDGMDVQVQAGSMFPWAKSAKTGFVTDLIELLPGLVTGASGEIDTMKLARYLDIGGIGAFQPEGDADLLEVQREQAKFADFKDGMDPLTIDPQRLLGFWQDHAKHAAGHRELLKRDRGQFDQWHPLAQKNFLLHLQLTDQTLTSAVQGMQPSGAPPVAAGDGGGPPGGPADGAGAPGAPETAQGDTQLTHGDMADAGIQ